MEDNTTRELNRKERREFERQQRKENFPEEERKMRVKKIIRRGLTTTITLGVILGIVWLIKTPSRRPNLPPTIMQGHMEDSPKAHIVTEYIPDSIQRHMLEHADGSGKPGVIIQYNCNQYDCEPDLVEKLTELAKQYPDNVYLAPSNYTGKIILTKLGVIKILENFDGQAIKDFISESPAV